jgi:hypothetical protein
MMTVPLQEPDMGTCGEQAQTRDGKHALLALLLLRTYVVRQLCHGKTNVDLQSLRNGCPAPEL